MVHLLTWHSWLKTGLPPTALLLLAKMNGHETRRTLTLLIIMSAELILEHILSQAIEHCWTEESPAINSR